MPNKELICRALLGDQEAQNECTEKGILIPYPWCKGEMQICHGDNYGYYKTKCICCGAESPEKPSEWEAISRNNTRPAPPIRKCGECALWKEEKECPGHSAAQSQEWNEKAMIFAVKLNQRRNNYEN